METPQRTNRGSAAALFVLAVVAVMGGVLIGTNPPRCGGDTMSPGDSCYSYRHGTWSYEEAARTASWAPLAGALLALVLAGSAVHQLSKGADRPRVPGATAPRPGSTPAPGGTSVRPVDALPLARTPAEATTRHAAPPATP